MNSAALAIQDEKLHSLQGEGRLDQDSFGAAGATDGRAAGPIGIRTDP